LDLSGDPSFRELVARTRAATLAAYAHDAVPLARILEVVRGGRAGASPVVSVLFDVLVEEIALDQRAGGCPFRALDGDRGVPGLALFFIVSPEGAGLRVWLEYARDIFEADTVRRMLRRFARLLQAALADPARRLSDLPLLDGEDEDLVRAWGSRPDNRA